MHASEKESVVGFYSCEDMNKSLLPSDKEPGIYQGFPNALSLFCFPFNILCLHEFSSKTELLLSEETLLHSPPNVKYLLRK